MSGVDEFNKIRLRQSMSELKQALEELNKSINDLAETMNKHGESAWEAKENDTRKSITNNQK